MNVFKIKENWNSVVDELSQKFASMTDDDLFFVEGQEEDLLERLRTKFGKSKEEILDMFNKVDSPEDADVIRLSEMGENIQS
jgi:uncharacterized protein YjbJ (UPF0337 family)